MKTLFLPALLAFSNLAFTQVLFQEKFTDVSNWVIIEDENGTASFETNGDTATLTMDNSNYATRIQDTGPGRLVPLDKTGHMEFEVTELTGGWQRVFVHVEEFERINATDYIYHNQVMVLTPQTTPGKYVINFSGISWLPNTTHIRFRIGGENWSSTQGTIRTTGLTYYGYASNTNMWTGTQSSDWNNANNWSQLEVPTASNYDYVIINPGNHAPTISGSASVATLTILSGAVLNVSSSGSLAIKGILTQNGVFNNAGTIQFNGTSLQTITGMLNSDGVVSIAAGASLRTNNNLSFSSTGSLLHGAGTPGASGAITGNIYYTQVGSDTNTVYNYWSAPIDVFGITSLNTSFAFAYDPRIASPTIRDGWYNASGNMVKGRGYITTGADTVTYFGVPSSGSYQVDVYNNNSGYNLLGNPYPSAISYDEFMMNNANNASLLEGTLYFWDDDSTAGSGYSSADYSAYNASGFVSGSGNGRQSNGNIAVGQGFFVKAQNNGQVEFDNTMRCGNPGTFFRKAPFAKFKLKVINPKNDYNEILMAFHPEATAGYDNFYDGRKLQGNKKLAMYTMLDTMKLAIQGLPVLDNAVTLEVIIEAGVAGTYTLDGSSIEAFNDGDVILLEDRLMGTFTNVRQVAQYEFNTGIDTIAGRFFLHFIPQPKIESFNESCLTNTGEVEISGMHLPYTVSVKDEQDNDVVNIQISDADYTLATMAEGTYTVTLTDSFGYAVTYPITVPKGPAVTAAFEVSETVSVGEVVSIINLSTGNGTYTWDMGDGIQFINDSPIYTYNAAGTYLVSMSIDNDYCSASFSKQVVVTNDVTGVFNLDEQVNIITATLNEYGNIDLHADNTLQPITYQVFDLQGKMLWQQTSGNNNISVPSNRWAKGLYLVAAQQGERRQVIKVQR